MKFKRRIQSALLIILMLPVFLYGINSYKTLEGTWKLNKKASSNYEALLKFQGRSYFERKTLASLSITQVIKVSSGKVNIKAITSIKTMSFTFHVDNKVHKIKNIKGKYISIKCRPSKNGLFIISKNSRGMVTVTRRYVSGNRMINRITMTSPEGTSVSATRVFNRVR